MTVERRTRILIVDDSAVMRSLLRAVISSDSSLEVAGTAADGASALQAIQTLRPDLVLLDVEMPVMDGLATLRELRARGHHAPVIMCSSLTQRGARVTIEALAGGAADYVTKPAGQSDREAGIRILAQELIPKVKALTRDLTAVPARGLRPGPGTAMAASVPSPAVKSEPRIVVIGVSTGGPAALDRVLPVLPRSFPLPVLVVQHMPEIFTGLLAERLNGHCGMEVREAVEGDPVVPGTIFVARGNWHLEVLPGASSGAAPSLHLTQSPLENHCRPAVDVLFRSVAAVYGGGVVAVVLTGMGSDGLAGCRLLRAGGSTVLAQDQATSTVWGMPGVVANAGLANRVLPLDAIGPEIVRLASAGRKESRPCAGEGSLSTAAVGVDYGYLRRLVQGYTQNVLDDSRDYLFDSRLARLLRQQRMNGLEELVDLLRKRKDPALERAVAEAMTINETSFFRDHWPFELLRTELLPRLIEQRRSVRTLRFWSAACSTGQEAVSIAILLREHFPQVLNWDIRIEGTDISSEVVERARAARYHRIEVNRGLPVRQLVKYFEQEEDYWVARRDLRDLCSFRQANLSAPPAWSRPFDLILLRNVMLYFSQETRRTLLGNLHRVMAGDGMLLLGVSEQASDSPLWTPVLSASTCYYKPKAAKRVS